MEFILDTNICIYLIKKNPVQVFDKFKKSRLGDVGISSITLAELQYGIKKSGQPEKNQLALNQFLLPLEIVDFGIDAAIEYGEIRAGLEKKEQQLVLWTQ
jgi:tRNA(fMet)-specific endonuclease VapC